MGGLIIAKTAPDGDYHLDGSSGEGISWRNVNGFPVNYVSPWDEPWDVLEDLPKSVLDPTASEQPYAGHYRITIDEDSYDGFWEYVRELYSERGILSPLDESVLAYDWERSCLEEAQALSPMAVKITSGSPWNILGRAIDRLAIAIDLLENAPNSQILPGFDIGFDEGAYKGNYADVVVGGRYLADEDRYSDDLYFGTIPVGAKSDPVTVKIENVSGEELTNITATLVDRGAYPDSSDWNFVEEDTTVFELYDGSAWTKATTVLVESLDVDESVNLSLRAAPTADTVSTDEYGWDGLLQVVGEYANMTTAETLLSNTIYSSTLGHKAIRLVIPAADHRIDKVRVRFKAYRGRLKVEEAWVGLHDGSTGSFKEGATPVQLLFSGEELLDIATGVTTSTWSDWAELTVAPGEEILVSYSGPLVGGVTQEAREAYYKDQCDTPSDQAATGFIAATTHFDVDNIEEQSRRFAWANVPLACTIPQYIEGDSFAVKVITEEFRSIMAGYGITFDYVS